MNKLSEEQKSKIKAGLELLCEENTSLDKIKKLSTLLKGTNPVVDKKLQAVFDAVEKFQQVQSGDVITLSANSITEDNEQNKKRKKLLLLLISSWKNLHSEINRIQELQQIISTTGVASKEAVVKTGKIAATAKGPLGAVTIIAAGVVAVGAFLSSKSVNITIKNVGCRPIDPVIEQKINLPGLKLPSEVISSGGEGVAVLPGIEMSVDATGGRVISLSALNFSKSFPIPYEIIDITYDGKSLMGKITEIKLSSSKNHELILRCTKNING